MATEVFDLNAIQYDEQKEITSDSSIDSTNLNDDLLEDYGMKILETEVETTKKERLDKKVILKKLQNYFYLDSSDESSICLRCGTTFGSNQNFSDMIQHLNNCEEDQNFSIDDFLAKEDDTFNQGYTSEEEKSFENRRKVTLQYGKRRIKSKVWCYFHLNADKTRNICNICSKTLVNNGGSTTNMWTHLNDAHNIQKLSSRLRQTEENKIKKHFLLC